MSQHALQTAANPPLDLPTASAHGLLESGAMGVENRCPKSLPLFSANANSRRATRARRPRCPGLRGRVLGLSAIVGAALLTGCAPYVNVPSPESYRGPEPMRTAPVPNIVVESLAYVTERYPVEPPFAVEIPEGATETTWLEINRHLPAPAMRGPEAGQDAPRYVLQALRVRGKHASVDVLLPAGAVPDGRTLIELTLSNKGLGIWIVTNEKRTYPLADVKAWSTGTEQ